VTRMDIGKRLACLPATLSDPGFLASEGIGNEIGFYVFAYDATDEPVVASYVPKIAATLAGPEHGLKVLTIDLYRLVLELLESRGVLQEALEMEAKQGLARMERAVRKIVRPDSLIQLIRAKLADVDPQLVLLCGVGPAYPLVRSHTILNNLHAVIDRVPLVMFFPGSYDGQELRLFDILKDDNYYRAFPLLETVR
jgi:hypothetical protein